MNLADFVGGPSWCHRFMRKNRLLFLKFCGLKPIVSSCGLYHGVGYNMLINFSKSDIFVAVRVIRHAGYCPENTVHFVLFFIQVRYQISESGDFSMRTRLHARFSNTLDSHIIVYHTGNVWDIF